MGFFLDCFAMHRWNTLNKNTVCLTSETLSITCSWWFTVICVQSAKVNTLLSRNSLVAGSFTNHKHLKQNGQREGRVKVCFPPRSCCWGKATAGGTMAALNVAGKKSLISSHGLFSVQFWHWSSSLPPVSPETSTKVAQVKAHLQLLRF